MCLRILREDGRILNHLNSWNVPVKKSIGRRYDSFEVSTDDEGNYRPLIAMPYRRSLTLRDARVLRNYRLPLGRGCSYLRASPRPLFIG